MSAFWLPAILVSLHSRVKRSPQDRVDIKQRAGTTKIYENLTKEYTSQKIRIIIIKKISKEKDWIYSLTLKDR